MSDIESLRQEAESLKNQIRVRRPTEQPFHIDLVFSLKGCSKGSMWCYSIASSTKCWSDRPYPNAHTTNPSWSSRQNLCYALGIRCKVNSMNWELVVFHQRWNLFSSSSRNLVSASQDGKLIVWDSYTTNKVDRERKVSSLKYCFEFVGSCYSSPFVVGNDMCLCSIWQFRRMRWSWQYLFDLFVENTRRQCTC